MELISKGAVLQYLADLLYSINPGVPGYEVHIKAETAIKWATSYIEDLPAVDPCMVAHDCYRGEVLYDAGINALLKQIEREAQCGSKTD